MSRHLIEIDFNIIKTLLLGMRGNLRRGRLDEAERWLDKMDEMVGKANVDSRGLQEAVANDGTQV